jgi:hypothetical protein
LKSAYKHYLHINPFSSNPNTISSNIDILLPSINWSDIPLIDIPFSKLDPILSTFPPSIYYIPTKQIPLFQHVFIKLLDTALTSDSSHDSAYTDLTFKKIFLIPVITLLNYCDQGLTRRTSLQRRNQLILDDNWSTFTSNYIRSTLIQAKTSQPANRKKLNITPSQSVSNALGLSSNENRIIKLCATGNIAKAFDSLTSLPSAPHNQQTINSKKVIDSIL